jgi:hypothetical protein
MFGRKQRELEHQRIVKLQKKVNKRVREIEDVVLSIHTKLDDIMAIIRGTDNESSGNQLDKLARLNEIQDQLNQQTGMVTPVVVDASGVTRADDDTPPTS